MVRIVFIGRTFDEYMRMFALQPEELRGRSFPDCPAGACSFTADANRRGAEAVAADIAYSYSAEVLQAKGLADSSFLECTKEILCLLAISHEHRIFLGGEGQRAEQRFNLKVFTIFGTSRLTMRFSRRIGLPYFR